jgi:sugar phosphate isomerase/epimerase
MKLGSQRFCMICSAWVAIACGHGTANGLEFGLVSYTLRESFRQDFVAALDASKAMGFRLLELSELYGRSADEVRELMDARGMFCPSIGCTYGDITGDIEPIALAARKLGAKYVRLSWIPLEGPWDHARVVMLADAFNRVGKVLHEVHGLEFCYHNHGYEFVPSPTHGTLMDELIALTDPRFVSFELDILWAYVNGVDPVQLMQRYPDRIRLLHLRDSNPATVDAARPVLQSHPLALGEGQMGVEAILEAAQSAGVRYLFIEDEGPFHAHQVPLSMDYLRLHGWLDEAPDAPSNEGSSDALVSN